MGPMLHDEGKGQARHRILEKQLAMLRPLAQAPHQHRVFWSHQVFYFGEGKPDAKAGWSGGGRVWVGIIWRYFKVLGRKGGTEEEGRREGARGRGGGVREGTDFITSFNSLAQPVLRYVLLTPFWQMHANSNPFLSSSFPTAILQFKADL